MDYKTKQDNAKIALELHKEYEEMIENHVKQWYKKEELRDFKWFLEARISQIDAYLDGYRMKGIKEVVSMSMLEYIEKNGYRTLKGLSDDLWLLLPYLFEGWYFITYRAWFFFLTKYKPEKTRKG